MKIDNSRIFIADVHHIDFRCDNIEFAFGDVALGQTHYETSEYKKMLC